MDPLTDIRPPAFRRVRNRRTDRSRDRLDLCRRRGRVGTEPAEWLTPRRRRCGAGEEASTRRACASLTGREGSAGASRREPCQLIIRDSAPISRRAARRQRPQRVCRLVWQRARHPTAQTMFRMCRRPPAKRVDEISSRPTGRAPPSERRDETSSASIAASPPPVGRHEISSRPTAGRTDPTRQDEATHRHRPPRISGGGGG